MESEIEKVNHVPRLSEEFYYSQEFRNFPDVIQFLGTAYDLRNTNGEGNALYRMTSESRESKEEPSYLEIDKNGYIVKQWN